MFSKKPYDPATFPEDFRILSEAIKVSRKYGKKDHVLKHMMKLLEVTGLAVVGLCEKNKKTKNI